MTPREFLVSKGLAKPGRGKFSKEAHDALEKARAEGVVFDEPVKPIAKPRAPKVEKPKKKTDRDFNVDPRAVRAWATANGVTVGKRGRIHPDVYEAYLAANADKPIERKVSVSDGKEMGQPAPRRFLADTFRGVDDGNTVTRTYRDCCSICLVSMGWCSCPNGPVIHGHDTVTLVRLTPVD